MIVLVPITIGVPAVLVLVPPAVLVAPATFSRLMQSAALVIGLRAVASMPFDGAVEFMVGVNDSTLTAVDILGVKAWRCAEEYNCAQDCAGEYGYRCAERLVPTGHEWCLRASRIL
jgi:hypothetical protein